MNSEKSGRDRAGGWKFAKLSGHQNELDFGKLLRSDEGLQKLVIEAKYLETDVSLGASQVEVDGAKKVESILDDGRKTTSKVDLELISSEHNVRISLKKSLGGQVWLISVPRFLDAVEHFGRPLSLGAKKALQLFIGGQNLDACRADFEQSISISKASGCKQVKLEIRQQRLSIDTLNRDFPIELGEMLGYFNANLDFLTELMFSRGLAKSINDHADLIIYNRAEMGIAIFNIKALIRVIKSEGSRLNVKPGSKNGGTTLIFPGGRLQMHKPNNVNQMQFRHEYQMLKELIVSDRDSA